MKTTPHHLAYAISCALLLTPFASAQPAHAGGAINAGGAAQAAIQRPVVAPSMPAGASVRGSASTNLPPTDRANPGLNPHATTHASVKAQERGLTVAALASSGATVEEIRTAAKANRDGVLANVDGQLEIGGQITANLRRQSRHLEGDAKVNFKAAMEDVKASEKTVRQSLREARKAKGDAQAEAQAKLADDYAAYTEAVARAEAAATVKPAPTDSADTTTGTTTTTTTQTQP
jgi:hypothetical protein